MRLRRRPPIAPVFEPPRPWLGHDRRWSRRWPMLALLAVLLGANAWLAIARHGALEEAISNGVAPAPTLVADTPLSATPAEPAAPDDPVAARMQALLQTPWAAWFHALEAELPARVALVALEPDGLSQRAELQAQGETLADLLAFAQALERSPLVAGLEPVAHLPDTDSASNAGLRMRWRITWRTPLQERP